MRASFLTLMLALATPAFAGDGFVPNPHAAFEGFVAINAPRPDVPVGALWIQGYGPTGPGAPLDNLETVRSLNGVSIDTNLQLSLSAGVFSLLGIDPHLRNHFVAHFTDLTIVRVKDAAKLGAPAGEPRIIAGLKAGSITVTSDGDFGLNARTIGFGQTKVQGTTANDRSRAFSIDGRDLFIAVRVATLKQIESKTRDFVVESTGGRSGMAMVDDARLIVTNLGCGGSSTAGCIGPASISFEKAAAGALPSSSPIPLDGAGSATLFLAMPRSDGGEGIYTRARVKLIPKCDRERKDGCGRHDRLDLQYLGEQLETLQDPKAKAW